MKYQKANVEVVKFDQMVEFMAASPATRQAAIAYFQSLGLAYCAANAYLFTGGKDYGVGETLSYNGIVIIAKHDNGHGGEWTCSSW